MPCQRFQFLVTADNDAGVGSPAIYNETVPICKFANTIHACMHGYFCAVAVYSCCMCSHTMVNSRQGHFGGVHAGSVLE